MRRREGRGKEAYCKGREGREDRGICLLLNSGLATPLLSSPPFISFLSRRLPAAKRSKGDWDVASSHSDGAPAANAFCLILSLANASDDNNFDSCFTSRYPSEDDNGHVCHSQP